MVQRNTEPEQDLTLTSETNAQDFPAKTTDSKAQQDNTRRVQATKKADASRQVLPGQEPTGESVQLTSARGTRVTVDSGVLADRLKAGGYS